MKEKLLQFIKKHGLLNTITHTGGYGNFVDIFPDFFTDKNQKINLIVDIVNQYEPDGYIYLYEIYGMDIKIWEEEVEDGHTHEDYIINLNNEVVGVSVYEYDEEGEMYDDEIDKYYIKFGKLDDKLLNKIFEILVGYYL